MGVGEHHRLAADQHGPLVRPVETGHDLDQRGLTGAVFSDQRVDFSRPELQIDLRKSLHTGETLCDPL